MPNFSWDGWIDKWMPSGINGSRSPPRFKSHLFSQIFKILSPDEWKSIPLRKNTCKLSVASVFSNENKMETIE